MESNDDLLEPDVIFWNSPLKWVILMYSMGLFTLFYFGFKWYLAPPSCEQTVKKYNEMEYKIVIQKNNSTKFHFKITGKELSTGKNVNIDERNSPFLQINKLVETGDTLAKQKGSLEFSLFKTKKIVKFVGLKLKCTENLQKPIEFIARQ